MVNERHTPISLSSPLVRAASARARLAVRCTFVLAALVATACSRERNDSVRDSIVRVTTAASTGTGFFVAAPDQRVLVATVYHVIAEGGAITVSRQVELSDSEHYVEAYPDTRVVAYDADADLALIELKNVPAKKLPPLRLADAVKDEEVSSYGFPGSNLVSELGLTRKDGTVSNFVKFPVIDRPTGRLIKEGVTDALIISSALEPGFSGGPTLNRRGEVVGINELKDAVHHAQNGATSAAALRKLLARVQKPTPPTAARVAKLLSELQSEYLALPAGERRSIRESSYVSLAELPKLRQLAALVVEAKEDDAMIFLSQLPGQALAMYQASGVRAELAECVKRNAERKKLLQGFGLEGSENCADRATRPLAAAMLSALVQWDGRPHEYTVSKIDEVNPAVGLYSAKIRRADSSEGAWTVQLVAEGDELKFRMFEGATAYALQIPTAVAGEDLTGRWTVTGEVDASGQTIREDLSIMISDDMTVQVSHGVRNSSSFLYEGQLYPCTSASWAPGDLDQSFSGQLKNGVIVAQRIRERTRLSGAKCGSPCGLCYQPDTVATFKRHADKLVMSRTDGASTESRLFVRSGG